MSFCCTPAFSQLAITLNFHSGVSTVSYDHLDAGPAAPTIIVLPGVSGPKTPYYQEQAKFLFNNGFTVNTLHYFDAAKSQVPSDATYRLWVQAVEDFVLKSQAIGTTRRPKIALVGYSLGASIALAAASQNVPMSAVVEWYGDLPDLFYANLKGMPSLLILHGGRDSNIPVVQAKQLIRLCNLKGFSCESKIYPESGHGFAGQDLKDADEKMLLFLEKKLK